MDSPIFVRLTNKQMCTLPKEAIHHACEPAVRVRFLIEGTPRMKQRYIFRLLSIYYLFLLGILFLLNNLYLFVDGIHNIENYNLVI
jgi:hypothetical protein